MTTNRIITTALVAFTILLFACNGKTSKQPGTADNQTDAAKVTSKGKYAIKSGIVEYKAQIMGMDMKQILTFDDYGNKEITEMVMDMMGTKSRSITLAKDGFQYTYDLEKKTGTKKPFSGNGSFNVDFENMSKDMIKDMNLKKEGTEEFLGKNCEKMSIDYKKMEMKGNFLVYKGVALKMDTYMGATKMKMVAEKFLENPSFPANQFEVPTDVKITENK